ncbi:MAG TPA: replication protein [Candidatus Thiothrix moscowensis]|uniref:replication protein n=1 Tax=Thiothrix sp. UBA2016 TaxID=1947695 RepID=UPI0025F5A339|nr:replication protein [Thiothrix sp. UBA2016]HRJ53082.1 replication protein [Candidatus Thiothrix moscowensis]HRJ93073.1 replication protein [Candidatus Thiothrix moscowensis]
MKELVTILDAALAADLGKRQWAVFAAVLRQTLGYRKLADDLSSGRLSQLTGIQRNHIWQAKQELVDKGLLVSAPGKFGEVLGFAVLHVSIHAPSEANLEGIIPRPNEFYPPRKGAFKPELVLHEKLSTGFACPSPLRATDSGYAVQQSATNSGGVSQRCVTVSVSATHSDLPDGIAEEVLHEKLSSPSPTPLPVSGTQLLGVPPDLGVPASQFRPESVPKQDTSLSNHTSSNHDNSGFALPSPQTAVLPTASVGSVGGDGVTLFVAGVDVSATDSGLCRPSASSCRSSATDSGCAALPALAGELEWPVGLDAGIRQDMAGLLCGLAVQTAQSVLDVLAMGLEAGKVRKPLAYLRVLVRSAHNGELVVAEAQAWREKRSRERAVRIPASVFERAGELAWIQQLADLQGLPVDVVASQLGVKMRLPHRTTVEAVGMAAASDVPAPQWKRERHKEPPSGYGEVRSVDA